MMKDIVPLELDTPTSTHSVHDGQTDHPSAAQTNASHSGKTQSTHTQRKTRERRQRGVPGLYPAPQEIRTHGWQDYTKRRASMERPVISITRESGFGVNAFACAVLGSAVKLAYNPALQQISFRPVDRSDPDAFNVKRTTGPERSAHGQIAAKAFLEHYGLDAGQLAGRYVAAQADKHHGTTLVIQLGSRDSGGSRGEYLTPAC